MSTTTGFGVRRRPPKSGLEAGGGSRFGEDVQALADGFDDHDPQPLGGRREVIARLPPDQEGLCAGVNDDVVTVFVAVVDDDVQVEGRRDSPARTLDHVDARTLEALRGEPSL